MTDLLDLYGAVVIWGELLRLWRMHWVACGVWKSDKWRLVSTEVKSFTITVVLEDIFVGREFLFDNVYRPNLDSDINEF